MPVLKLHWPSLLVSALAMYAIGALLYGLIFSEAWLIWSGYTKEGMAAQGWRVMLSPIMPLLLAAGIGAVLQWCKPANLSAALGAGFTVWLFLLWPARLYNWVYGDEPLELLLLDSGHLLANALIASAISQAWPKKSAAGAK